MSLVEIKPDVLEYKPPFTEQSTEYATITNNSEQTIAFKVKTTAPKFYCVRPNAAVVQPGETVQVQVIFLGLPEEPAADFNCRDKFLVITLPAPHDLGEKTVAEAWSELEGEFSKQAISKKIKVKYLIDYKPEEAGEIQREEEEEQQEESTVKPIEKEDIEKPVEEPKEDVVKPLEKDATGPKENENGSINIFGISIIVILALFLRWYFY
ncbi:hypothetical protein KAFR_0K02030 [Kazachstania africana CBS 2517]|uniref:MSP domain-containing protein n=1 Tax=Kazachstania africana (strain ATCC 22294 / BCRC 22015 / CBS 2517 / CECT 1963 / NBRC 1671 / NRRL Y-8276) TaxID=1071382 RepID=H2B1Q7_KAZAF|nr:hypothetical protein KAFR_0K02030 [Kazachstania africana CBS 2517]CCF60557.1 hypothetical protein KAFR_0K02030 [Kazachstania africana CBS 2517]